MSKLKQLARQMLPTSAIQPGRRMQATTAAMWHGNPAKKLTIIGVTGTNGKTSVYHYITQLLESAGYKTGMVTTVAIQINGKRQLNTSKMTTVNPMQLHSYLAQMVAAGCRYAVVETTSHALDQERVHGIYYNTVVFTNLTHDHLDYHKNMDEYRKAKEKLFAHSPKVSVVNADDPSASEFLKYPAMQKYTYGIDDARRPKGALPNPDVSASLIKFMTDNTSCLLKSPFGEANVAIPLPGRFTLSNALAAVSVALAHGVSLEQVKATLAQLKPVEGRLEVVDFGQPYTIIVDFAHTPDALQQVYDTLRPSVSGKLIAVLGATGKRDKTKRPILGALAARYSDFVIVTNEDPYDEDPNQIINEVAEGVKRGRPNNTSQTKGEGEWWWRVADRREGIAKALSMAKPGDCVIVTGKGGEHVMAIGDKLVPYNDVNVIKSLLHR